MAGEIINIGSGVNYIAHVRASVSPGASTAVGVNRAPTEDDDGANTGGIGFVVERGALWEDTTTGTLYYCSDATAGAAEWTALESASAATDHNVLTNRDAEDQHPIAAITDLADELDALDVSSIATYTVASAADFLAASNAIIADSKSARHDVGINGVAITLASTDTPSIAGRTVEYLGLNTTGVRPSIALGNGAKICNEISASARLALRCVDIVSTGGLGNAAVPQAQSGCLTIEDCVYVNGGGKRIADNIFSGTMQVQCKSSTLTNTSTSALFTSSRSNPAVGGLLRTLVSFENCVTSGMLVTTNFLSDADGLGETIVWVSNTTTTAGAFGQLNMAGATMTVYHDDPNIDKTPPAGYDACTFVLVGAGATIAGKEAALGNPATDGYVLASTTAGVRSWVAAGGAGTTDHDDLTNRDAADQHPTSAITGLSTALGDKYDVAGGEIDGDVDVEGYVSVSGGLVTGTTGAGTTLAYDCAFVDRTSRPWPVLAETQRDAATKALGSVCYNDDSARLEIWNGAAWAPVAGGGAGTTDHRDLTDRDAADQHPIAAITGLTEMLDPWYSLTPGDDFTAVATSVSPYLTIAMYADKSAMLQPGMLMRAAFGETVYPFLVVSCTSTELLLAGCAGPFDEEIITTLDYCVLSNPWIRQDILVPGNWCDTTDIALLEHDLELQNFWRDEPAYLTAIALSSPTISGSPEFAVTIGGTAVSEEIGPSEVMVFKLRGVLPAAMTPVTLDVLPSDVIELDVTTAVATGNSGLYVTLFYAPKGLLLR